jgi:hypothetical protein
MPASNQVKFIMFLSVIIVLICGSNAYDYYNLYNKSKEQNAAVEIQDNLRFKAAVYAVVAFLTIVASLYVYKNNSTLFTCAPAATNKAPSATQTSLLMSPVEVVEAVDEL